MLRLRRQVRKQGRRDHERSTCGTGLTNWRFGTLMLCEPEGREAHVAMMDCVGGADMNTTLTARPASPVDINSRVAAVDWAMAATHLDTYGWAMLKTLLAADECESIAGLYEDDRQFRSHVVMARHGFGRGEYKYFAYPLPDIAAELRMALFPRLVAIANRWNESMGIDVRFPAGLKEFI